MGIFTILVFFIELQEARRLIRKFPQCPLVKSDVKRPEVLWESVALVEVECKWKELSYLGAEQILSDL